MADDNDWDNLVEEVAPAAAVRQKKTRRAPIKNARSGQKLKRHYAKAYNTTKLEKLMAARGEKNAKNLALQRGKTLVTRKKTDLSRAQIATNKTFNGLDVLSYDIPYDKNQIVAPENRTLAAQFGNYQAQKVAEQRIPAQGLTTRRPCPI